MATEPALPWKLNCPWCGWYILVFGRGMRGRDPGAGVEAAELAKRHVHDVHGETWEEFLRCTASIASGA